MSAHLQDELLAASLDGTLSAADRDAVDAHLEVCERCRGELEVARGARAALRDLPAEVRPPIDLAAAVASRISGRASAEAAAPSGPPRWYRAAGLVAAAAAIVLAIVVLPDLGDRASKDQAAPEAAAGGADTAAASATSPEYATTEGGSAQDRAAVEDVPTDFDAVSLQGLVDDAAKAASLSEPTATSLLPDDLKAADCVRAAAGEALPPDAPNVRLLAATYERTPVYLGVFSLADGRAQAWVASRTDCRLLASATSAG